MKLGKRARRNLVGYGFIGVNFLWVLFFTGYPVLKSLVLSFSEWNPFGQDKFIGLANYKELIMDWTFGLAYKNAAYYALLTIPAGLILAIGMAMLLSEVRLKTFFRTLYFLPSVCSSVAIALVWQWIYQPEFGLLNSLLRAVGVKGPAWLLNTHWAMPALSIVVVWANAGYWMVIFLAGLLDIPASYYEAAAVDGATGWQMTRHITLPLLTPTIFFYLTMAFITVWQQFDLVYVMTRGGPANATLMPAYLVYQAAFKDFRMGYASAMAWVMFVITFVISILNNRYSNRWVDYAR